MAITRPVVSPVAAQSKRSTRKRQRPAALLEVAVDKAPVSTSRSRRRSSPAPRQSGRRAALQSSRQASTRTELSVLQETVSEIRAQVETATAQMTELRGLIQLLAASSPNAQEPASPQPSSARMEDSAVSEDRWSSSEEEDEWVLASNISPNHYH